ncbi:MAG: hypothetical protein NXY59_09620 [Aigarchaeota archaeon]|nr:hypothetical protein [Candidatus Pelearchaeum maunauluense]
MSEAFRKALNHIQEQKKKGVEDVVIQEKLPEFRDGAFVVNRYIPSNPPLLGMAAKDLKLDINRESLRLVEKFAKRRGLTMKVSGDDIFLVNKEGAQVAWLKRDTYAAADPELFQDIGKVLYRVSPDLLSELELMDGWQAAVARLLADRRLLDKLFVAIFFLISPFLWTTLALFLTPSLAFPREFLIGAGVVGLALTAYLVRLYLRENFPKG